MKELTKESTSSMHTAIVLSWKSLMSNLVNPLSNMQSIEEDDFLENTGAAG